jgi:RHS repeat-associated protein
VTASVLPLSPLTPTAQSDFDGLTNRLQSPNLYDLAGHHTRDESGRLFTYDAEGRQSTFTDASGTTTYAYDGDGRRVRSIVQGARTTYVYDALGRLAGQYGRASADQQPGVRYLTKDHLGSTRLVSNAAGAILARHDYLPFGEELGPAVNGRGALYAGADGVRHLFTGKERDGESGLDYFGARYFSSALGRFTSADAPLADQFVEIPQSWNLYAYVRNNPLLLVDRTGRSAKKAVIGRMAEQAGMKALFDAARARAVRQAWRLEQELVRVRGVGTRDWTTGELELLKAGKKVPGYQGHHINSVAAHELEMAGDPRNVSFKKMAAGGGEHLADHGGNYQNDSFGPLIDRQGLIDEVLGSAGEKAKSGEGILGMLLSLLPGMTAYDAGETAVDYLGKKVDEMKDRVNDGEGVLGARQKALEEAYRANRPPDERFQR